MELSFGGFLVFAIIGLSMTLQMQSGTAAISCEPDETIVSAAGLIDGKDCRKELQTKCGLQGGGVSHLEFNAWDPNKLAQKACEGCCRIPSLPCNPVLPPAAWTTCSATDINKTFQIPNYSGNDCHRCKDGCKTRCDAIEGAKVHDQICGYLGYPGKPKVGLYCTCCCRKSPPCNTNPPPPTPPPPPPTPSPPPPSPPPRSSCGNCCPVDIDIQISVKQGSGEPRKVELSTV